jgi:hypothetical protein
MNFLWDVACDIGAMWNKKTVRDVRLEVLGAQVIYEWE